MKKFAKKVLTYAIIFGVVFLLSTVLFTYFYDKTIGFNPKYIQSGYPLMFGFFVVMALLIRDLLKSIDGKPKKGGKADDQVKDEKGRTVKEFFSKDFVEEDTLKKDKAFNYNTPSSLKSCKKDGVLVRAEERGNNMDINFVEPIHTLVVGTTSSGKTWRYVIPTIQILSSTAAKPSFVVTDPKGELYDTCTNKLKKEGYDVKVVELRDPSVSTQWNPLSYPYDMWHRSFNLDKEVRVHAPGDNPKNYNLMIQSNFDFNTSKWYEFNGTAYYDSNILESDMRAISVSLQNDTFTAVSDICNTLAPVESAKDPTWEKTARRLLQGIIWAMLEDSMIPELGLTREKFNLYNVYKIVNTTDSGSNSYATLKEYLFDYRDKFSKVPDLCASALKNADGTSKNYMGFATGMVSLFSDSGISFLTANTEIDIEHVDDKPTAIFLIIPDEIRVRYPLAVLFVTQLYKRLVDKAQDRGGKLKRHVYFLLDEFGNMPKFPEFGSTMAVGRSRGIYFTLCVQSYSQLYQNYGQDEGKIIKDNCPIQVYVASEDMATNKEFSELLGKKTISKTSENKSTGADGKENKSSSTSTQSIPIAYPEELMSFRDKGQIIIKTFTPNAALKTKITPAYKAKFYDITKLNGVYRQRRLLDESSVFYDIKNRNKILSKNSSSNDDDDDDFFF